MIDDQWLRWAELADLKKKGLLQEVEAVQRGGAVDGDSLWVQFYRASQGRQARALFTVALTAFAGDGFDPAGAQAVDLGCGDGTETAALLAQGWYVLAIDQEPAAIASVIAKAPAAAQPRLQARAVAFEAVELPAAHFVYAGVSLPFCAPEHFPGLWAKVVKCLRPGGRFAGHFFGERDGWHADTKMTFHTVPDVQRLFTGFTVESFVEVEEDKPSALGEMKHWHSIEVVARRRAAPGAKNATA
ncbi:MAG: methyltransferase domain-containing protein [Caldilineaceae bacterium]